MVIDSFDIDKTGRIIVNGNKLMWVSLSDIKQFGNDSMTYQDRFILYLNERKPGINVVCSKSVKASPITEENIRVKKKIDNSKAFTHIWGENYKEKHKLGTDKLLELLSDKIDELTNLYYKKYKKYLSIEKEDIKQEIIIAIIEMKEKCENNHWGGVRDKALNSFIYLLKVDLDQHLYNRLSGYSKTFSISNKDMKTLEELRTTELEGDNIFKEGSAHREDIEELAEKCIMPIDRLYEYLKLYDMLTSTEYNIDEIQDNASNHYKEALYKELQEVLFNVIKRFTPRQRIVIEERFGLHDNTPKTLEQVAKKLKISKERTRQIECRALRRLRHPSVTKQLKDFLAELD